MRDSRNLRSLRMILEFVSCSHLQRLPSAKADEVELSFSNEKTLRIWLAEMIGIFLEHGIPKLPVQFDTRKQYIFSFDWSV